MYHTSAILHSDFNAFVKRSYERKNIKKNITVIELSLIDLSCLKKTRETRNIYFTVCLRDHSKKMAVRAFRHVYGI